MSRPVSGTYDIHANEVTTNIFGSMHYYAHSVEMFKSLRKINSYAQSVNDMLQKFDTPNDLKWIQRMVKKARTTSDKERVRARSWAINNIIEHWFQGQNLAGRDFKSKKFIAQIPKSGLSLMQWLVLPMPLKVKFRWGRRFGINDYLTLKT